jgi:hypothetical protein
MVQTGIFPTIAVVNLKTGELTRWLEESDLNDADQFGADIIEKVKEANQ